MIIRNSLSIALVSSLFFSQTALALPSNSKLVGAESYHTMTLNKVAKPQLLWVNSELMRKSGFEGTNDLLNKVAYASKVDGEKADIYTHQTKTAYVDAYGGVGLNGNFGSGRAAIVDDWQIKGSGKTMMVNEHSDSYHRSGASVIREGIWEAAWSKLLNRELPYGAYETLAVIATGSQASLFGTTFDPRVLIIRQDPVRPAHFVLNPTKLEVDPKVELARVSDSMNHIVEALPKPEGFVSKDRKSDFVAGVYEMIDRQAIQNGVAWAKKMYHGGITPSNVGLDGRMIDFGSFSAFDGYPKARLMDVSGHMGEMEGYELDLLKDVRDSWLKTLPKDLLSVLPSEKAWYQRFSSKFDEARNREMVRNAGAIDEFLNENEKSAATDSVKAKENKAAIDSLGATLVKIANFGNEEEVHVYAGESPFRKGTYKIDKILSVLATLDLNSLSSYNSELESVLADHSLRAELVAKYREVFGAQMAWARSKGISAESEALYRRLASEIRNKSMASMFRTNNNQGKISEVIEQFGKTGDSKVIQNHIDKMVSMSRRDFRDGAPMTLVLREKFVEDGSSVRDVFNLKSGKVEKVRVAAPRLINSCRAIFAM